MGNAVDIAIPQGYGTIETFGIVHWLHLFKICRTNENNGPMQAWIKENTRKYSYHAYHARQKETTFFFKMKITHQKQIPEPVGRHALIIYD